MVYLLVSLSLPGIDVLYLGCMCRCGGDVWASLLFCVPAGNTRLANNDDDSHQNINTCTNMLGCPPSNGEVRF